MEYSHLTSKDHLSPDRINEQIGDIEQTVEVANELHELQSEIAHKRALRRELFPILARYDSGKYPEGESAQPTLAAIHEKTQEIKELEQKANAWEDEKAIEYETAQKNDKSEVA